MEYWVDSFRLPKRGAPAAEYEDAYAVAGGHDPQVLRVVVADGASESMLASRWARCLVAMFGEAPEDLGTADGFVGAYQRAVASWDAEVARYIRERTERNFPIQWYEEPGLAKGAHSTLLAVEFTDACWTAVALGDSCLFQVRAGELRSAFPMEKSDGFSYQPPLLSSRGTDAEVLSRYLCFASGDLVPGDTCYLATDALSAWFLKAVEEGKQPWRMLDVLDESAPGEFAELVDKLRDNRTIKDDDTTLVRVDVE
jgi:hypothetical protein